MKIDFGHITETDGKAIMHALNIRGEYTKYSGSPLRYLEIGPFGGGTTRGVHDFCKAQGIQLDCWGVDVVARAPRELFGEGQYVIESSDEAWRTVRPRIASLGGFDVVFVDGCHCINHVALDALHYSELVKPGGYMLFHDAAAQVQHVQTNDWVHPEDKMVHRTAVRDALQLIGWPNGTWKLMNEFTDPEANFGGVLVYRKWGASL